MAQKSKTYKDVKKIIKNRKISDFIDHKEQINIYETIESKDKEVK